MPTKLDIKKLRREMLDFKRGDVKKANLTFNAARLAKFQDAVSPASASEVLDYLMECVISGNKKK